MKKVTAILAAVIMIFAVFAGAVSAVDWPDDFYAYSFDWYAYAGAFLSQSGHCEDIVANETPIYELHADPNADIVGFYGWAALKDTTIKTFGIKLNGGDMIDSPLSRIQNAGLDRTAELNAAGIPNGEGFWLVFNYSALGEGKHHVTFYAIDANDNAHEMFGYDFIASERAPVMWLCDPAGAAGPGYWNNGPFVEGRELTATFTAPAAFEGICIGIYANPSGATFELSLLDSAGKVLETLEHTQAGDGAPSFMFSKTYQPGTYTLRIVSKSTQDGENGWLVIGTGAANEIPVTFGGDMNPGGNLPGLQAFLLGALTYTEEDPGDQPDEPSPTSDAAIIAIAALGCIALAGAVVAKKIR